MKDFLKKLKVIDKDARIMADVKEEPFAWVDTGSYVLNALCSASIYGGFPDNLVIGIAGMESTGKTFFTLGIIAEFLRKYPTAIVVYFDTEHAIYPAMLSERGIDTERFVLFNVNTAEEFRTKAYNMIQDYKNLPTKDKAPMLMVLDSLGNLSTNKEVADIAAGNDKRDMTRSQILRSLFRVITLEAGLAHIPLIVTNHVYDVVGSNYPLKEMGGGGGLKYAASIILELSKSKEKDKKTNEVIGNIIKVRARKSRLSKENKEVEVLLRYDSGIDRYYGLLPLALKYDIFKKLPKQIELPDGTKVFESKIIKKPEQYFTEEVLQKIESYVKLDFAYGHNFGTETTEEEEENE